MEYDASLSACHEAYSDSVSLWLAMCELDGLTTSADGVADSVHVPR